MRYLDRLDGAELAREALPALVARTGETATVAMRSGGHRIYVAQHLPPRSIRMTVQLGIGHPLHAGAASKVLLAFAPRADREAQLDHALVAVTPNTVTSPDRLRAELASIRDRGYAVSLGERQVDAAAVAAPVLDARGAPLCTVGVCGPIERFRDRVEDSACAVVGVAREMSARLGYRRPRPRAG
jgi:DNA-binding IclR family transcriptional regulator